MKNIKYVLTQDLTIPAGTVLDVAPNNKGGTAIRTCVVGVGNNFTGDFSVTLCGIEDSNGIIVTLK